MRSNARTVGVIVLLAGIVPYRPARSGEVPDWQEDNRWARPGIMGKGRGPDKGAVTLGFKIVQGNAAWPRLRMDTLQGRRTPYLFPTTYCDLGEVRVPGRNRAGTPHVQGDWSYARLSYGGPQKPFLRMWVSRLSPALLVQTPGDRLVLFAGRRAFSGIRGRGQVTWKGGGPPGTFAVSRGDSAEVMKGPSLSSARFDEGKTKGASWLLGWFGKGSGVVSPATPFPHGGKGWIPPKLDEVDCPVLMVFDSPPAGVASGRAGLEVRFSRIQKGRLHTLAVLPLYGDLMPSLSETEGWAAPGRFPPAVAEKCRWWADHLAQFPYSAAETYDYDAPADLVSITEEIRYLKIRDGGRKFAPLPPMAALALTQGFPVQLETAGRKASYSETSVLTFHGPYGGVEGADSYQLKVPGMADLVHERRESGPPAREDAELVKELEEQVRKVVQAGHLRPWYCARNCYGAGYRCYWRHSERFVWSNPGETLYVLSMALPLVSPELRREVIAYMKKERADYPPEKVTHTPVSEGARREWHRPGDPEIFREHQGNVNRHNFYLVNKLVPEETLYYLAEYYNAVGPKELDGKAWGEMQRVLVPYLYRQDWATLGFWPFPIPWGNCWDGWGGVADANCHFAGLVGYLRLAGMAGEEDEVADYWGLLARAAMWRGAIGRYAHYLHDKKFYVVPRDPAFMAKWFEGSWVGQLITYDWTGPLDDVRQVTIQSPYGVQFSDSPVDRFHAISVMPFLDAVPELGRLAGQYLKPELKAFSDRYELTMPSWFIAKCTTEINAEFSYIAPEETYQVFLIRAWVVGEPGEKLEGYLDTPWMERGDLYYIHKLVETIMAYRKARWRKQRP